jgi:PhnB protein
MKKNYIAKGYNAVMPALAFNGADTAISWYISVLGAKEKMRLMGPDNTVSHAEITIGDSVIMISEQMDGYNQTPTKLGGNSVNLYVYVPDVDATLKKAVDNKAKLIMEAEDQFYGDRCGRFEDPFGYVWIIATHVREVSEEEMKKGMEQMAQQEN